MEVVCGLFRKIAKALLISHDICNGGIQSCQLYIFHLVRVPLTASPQKSSILSLSEIYVDMDDVYRFSRDML